MGRVARRELCRNRIARYFSPMVLKPCRERGLVKRRSLFARVVMATFKDHNRIARQSI